MPTQIIQVDVGGAPRVISVRDDVSSVLVVALADGEPVDLLRLPRPADGLLSSREIVAGVYLDHRSRLAPRPTNWSPISIVIPTHERPDDLACCLQSLSGARAAGHEVLLVDNAPVTSRTAAVADRFGVRLITEPVKGLSRARNAGLASATYDIVAYLDDDVVVSPGWADAILQGFADPTVASVTGLVLPLELETAAQEEFERYCQHWRSLKPCVYSSRSVNVSTGAILGMGGNAAYRRNLLCALGGFDVRLGAGTRTKAGEDADMFARVLGSGHRLAYHPRAYVWHRYKRTPRDMRAQVFGYSAGTFGMLTKRLVERRDVGALTTAARWLAGPPLKAMYATVSGVLAPPWRVVLADTAGALCGPLFFGQEAWRNRRDTKSRLSRRE